MKMHPPIRAQESNPPLIDNVFCPEIIAGGISGLSIFNGIVSVTLENARCDHSKTPPPLERVVVGRISMSVPAAQALLSVLYQFLNDHNLNPLAANAEVTTQ